MKFTVKRIEEKLTTEENETHKRTKFILEPSGEQAVDKVILCTDETLDFKEGDVFEINKVESQKTL